MENREQVVADYFKLRVLLNRSNSKSNQKTEIDFIVHQNEPGKFVLFAALTGVQNAKMIEICHRTARLGWEGSGYSGLFACEDFCTSFLKKGTNPGATINDFKALTAHLMRDLRSLGISR